MTTPSADKTVQYNILLNAQQALKELQAFNKAAIGASGVVDSLEARIRNFERVVAAEAKKAGVSFEQQLEAFKKLDASLKTSRKSGVVGNSGGVDVFTETKIMHDRKVLYDEQQRAAKAAFAANTANINKEIDGLTNLTDAHKKVANGATQAGIAGEKGANKATVATRAWTIATGMLIHQGIMLLINALQQMFTMAIKGLRELETATYNLVNAERTLSEQGVAISPKNLDDIIKRLQEIDPLLSKIQATEVVSRAATLVAPNVGFNAAEIEQFSQAVAVLAVRNRGLGKSFEEVESQISNAFLSGKVSVGINQLGVKITDQIVKDEALRLGLVKTGEEFDKLTGKMEANIKARAMLSVLTQNVGKEISHLPEFFKSADAKFGIFQARLQDVFTKIGTLLAPILIKFFDVAIKGLERLAEFLDKNEKSISLFANAAAQLIPVFAFLVEWFFRLTTAVAYGIQLFTYFIGRLSWIIEKIPALKKFIDSISFKEIGDSADTATASVMEFGNAAEESANKFEEATDKMKEGVAELAKEMSDKAEDLRRDYGDKLEDIARNAADKLADAARKARDARLKAEQDYGDKLGDITKDTNEKVESTRRDYRQKEIDREREKNNKLEELRRKFLMDLEDALRERDARAVLKLIRNYNAEKKNIEDTNKETAKQDKIELQRKLQDIELERQQKVEAARKEYEDKLREIEAGLQRERAEISTARRREIRDAQTWYQRQLEDQRIYLQRKLRDLADAIAKEYQLTAAGKANLQRLMQSYYTSGIGGTGAINPLSGGVSTGGTNIPAPVYTNQQSGIGSGLYNPYDIRSRGGGFAEGGTLLATRPTTVTFGETPEIATFTPITRMGQNMNDLVVSGGQGKGTGKANVVLTLSPDLRAEIVENSLETMAIHVERLVRND